MPKFLAIYTGTATATEKAQAEGRIDEAAGMKAWGKWMENHAAAIVDAGGPLGKTKKVSPDGIAEITNTAAAEMFRGHAHFTKFPGEGVEVMPILDMPG